MLGDYHYYTIANQDEHHAYDSEDLCFKFQENNCHYTLSAKKHWHHFDYMSIHSNQTALYTWLEALSLRQGITDIGILFQTEMEKIFDAFLRIKLAEALKSEVKLPNQQHHEQLVIAKEELKQCNDPRKILIAKLP
jgi:hypothetical protein